MSISIAEVDNYKHFGKCLRICDAVVEIIVTIDFGPRIIKYGWLNGKNLLYESDGFEESRRNNEWHIVGGHRLWHSPEKYPRTWLPDWDNVSYRVDENIVILTQKVENWVQVEKEIHIRLNDDSTISLKHVIRNKNAWSIKVSAWAITAVAPGGMMIVKQQKRRYDFAYSFEGGRVIALWPYANMSDERVHWGDRFVTLNHEEGYRCPFKFGISNYDAWAAYVLGDMLFVKKYEYMEDAEYPDGGVSFESYTDDNMLEMETLSPLVDLKPDEELEHVETWSLYHNMQQLTVDETGIEILLCGIV